MDHVRFCRELKKYWHRKGSQARSFYEGLELKKVQVPPCDATTRISDPNSGSTNSPSPAPPNWTRAVEVTAKLETTNTGKVRPFADDGQYTSSLTG